MQGTYYPAEGEASREDAWDDPLTGWVAVSGTVEINTKAVMQEYRGVLTGVYSSGTKDVITNNEDNDGVPDEVEMAVTGSYTAVNSIDELYGYNGDGDGYADIHELARELFLKRLHEVITDITCKEVYVFIICGFFD